MEYCTFKTDRHRSEVDVFRDDDGQICVIVAESRLMVEVPERGYPDCWWMILPPWLSAMLAAHSWELRTAPRKPIDAPEAGKWFYLPDELAAYRWLCDLRSRGFRVPDACLFNLMD